MSDQLQTAVWAQVAAGGLLKVDTSERPIRMCNSEATGEPLLLLRNFGADIIRFAPREGVALHTHEGDHVLFVLSGRGVLTFGELKIDMFPGLCYLVPGLVEHAIDAETELVIIVVGNDHHPLDCEERMTLAGRAGEDR